MPNYKPYPKSQLVNEAIGCFRCNPNDEWYSIELVDHENVTKSIETSPNHFVTHYSGWICDSDVEGTEEEMQAIAEAIIYGACEEFKRCAVDATNQYFVYFWSPRNSSLSAKVPNSSIAVNLAKDILRKNYRSHDDGLIVLKEPIKPILSRPNALWRL